MFKNGIRNISLLLALIMAASAISCGDSTSEETTQVVSDTSDTESETTDNTVVSGVPADIDLGGRTITVLNSPQYENFLSLMNVTEETGDTMNDAIYRRNNAVMDNLNVTLEFNDCPSMYQGDYEYSMNYIKKTTASGDKLYDFIVGTQHRMTAMVTEGYFRDIKDLPYVDINQPWWAKEYIEKVNIGDDKRFFIAGDISVEFIRDIDCIYYNKTVYENYFGNPDEIYDIVLDGKWTLDKLIEMTKDTYVDLNQNNTPDEEDQYGYGLIPPTIPDHLYYSAGGTTIVNKDGTPTLDVVNDLNVGITEKIYQIYYGNDAAILYTENDLEAQEQTIPGKLAADDFMFMFGMFYFSDFLRNMDSDYGIIPNPKYDESQDGYKSLVHDGAPLCCIPVTTLDEDIDAVAAVIEEMAYQSYMITTPEYYNVVLKQKYARDSSDKAMKILDMIRANAFTDTGYVYNYAINGVGLLIRTLMMEKQSNLATAYASVESLAKESLNELIEAYTGLEQ